MQNNFKIAVIGGTGKSGQFLTRQLLQQGFHLKMLLRDPKKLTREHPFIEVIPGNARDYAAVHSLVKDCQAVLSTLGGHIPGEPPIFSHATSHVLRAMKECGVNRYVLTTGLNVDTPFDKKSGKTALATKWMMANYPLTTADKQTEWELLAKSESNWTLVRLPLIELTDEKSEIMTSLEDCPGEKISATDLADFLIGQLTDTRYLRAAPFLANR